MKTIKYILMLVLVIGTASSCLIDNETSFDDNDKGSNLAGFTTSSTSLAAVADGNEYSYTLPMKVFGPTIRDVKSTVTATVAVDPSSTAVEGVNFRLDSPTITFLPGNNLLTNFPITILTEGIMAPVDEAPVIVLKVTDVTGASNVVGNGKPIAITINYGCYSDLAGDYDVTITITRTISGAVTTSTYTDKVTKTGLGEYRTDYVGPYAPGDLAPGDNGFTFLDVCNELTVPEQNLGNYYSNIVSGDAIGISDPVAGTLHFEYTITTTAAAGFRKCVAEYVKKTSK
jgi:hypothetical protein